MNKKSFKLTKKKGIIISVPLIALILCIIGYYVFIDNKLVNTNPNNEKIAIYANGWGSYEDGVKDENYSPSSYTTITELASNGYILNETMSTCTNGATLTYDSTNKTVGLTTTSATQCTLYFDYSPHTINGTIEAYTAGSAKPVGTFNSITEAADAAGVNGRIVLSSGTFEFGQAQYIKYDGITLEGNGIDSTTITTNSLYSSASTISRQSLLTLEGSNITVQNLSFDGGNYGSTLILDNTAETEFTVIRVNSGSSNFDNVYITGSNRYLMSIGTRTTYAKVVATRLYADAPIKSIENIYYNYIFDIDLMSGVFTINDGCKIDALIYVNEETEAGELENNSTTVYTPRHGSLGIYSYYPSSLKHLAQMYWANKSFIDKSLYASDMNKTYNIKIYKSMFNEIQANINNNPQDYQICAEALLDWIGYAKTVYPLNTDIANLYTDLYTILYSAY